MPSVLLLAGALELPGAPGPCDSSPATTTPGANQSEFCAVMNVKQGKLAVVYDLSRFHPSPASGYQIADEPALRKKFAAMTNGLLQKGPALYKNGLRDTETAQEQKGTLPHSAIEAVDKLNAETWADARKAFDTWSKCPDKPAGSPCSRNNGAFTFQTAIKRIGGDQLSRTTPFSNPRGTGSQGVARFQVDDLVGDLTKPGAVTIQFDRGDGQSRGNGDILSAAQIVNWLSHRFQGKLWIAIQIEEQFKDVYAGLGMQPEVFPSKAGDSRGVTICESYTVGRIHLPSKLDDATRDQAELSKILYNLLTKEEFALDWMTLIQPVATMRFLKFADLHKDAPLPYLDLFRLADEQANLQGVGYGVATQSAPTNVQTKCGPLDLVVTALAKDAPVAAGGKEPASPAAPATTPSNPPPSGTAPAAAGDEQGVEPPVPPPPAASPKPASPIAPQSALPAATDKPMRLSTAQALKPLASPDLKPRDPSQPPTPLKKPSVTYGAGVEYRSGQGLRPIGSINLPTLQSAMGITTLTATGGADGTHFVLKGNFLTDYILFGKPLRHRLSFELTAGTDVTAKRVLAGQSTDERKTGGVGRLEYDAVHDWHNVFVQLFAEGQSHKITLSRSDVELASLHLNTISGGATIDMGWPARLHSGFLRIAPVVYGGIGLADQVPTFTIGSLDVQLHQRLSDFQAISLDVAGHFKQAQAATPIFELPSFGGAEMLRGFRQDDALGRRLWSLQSEVWTLVPGTQAAQSGVLRFLRQNIRLAGFVDVGGVYQTRVPVPVYYGTGATQELGPPGTRTGAGAGIRYIQGNSAIKLDWGHSFDNGLPGSGRNRFYLGIATTRSF